MENNTLNDRQSFFGVMKTEPMFLRGERDWSVDVLRCLSCFMVCAIHSTNLGIDHDITSGGDNIWLYREVYRMIFASPTVLFVMVSGIFFLSPERNVRAPKVWKKNVIKMAFAYIFWCLIYALYDIFLMDPRPDITLELLFQQWLIEPAHLWYIPMIIVLYILCPVIRPITATGDKKLFAYIIALFIGGMILWTVDNWPPTDQDLTRNLLLDRTPMDALCQYSFWMIFGWIAYTYRPKRGFRYLIYLAGIVATLIGIYCNIHNWYVHSDVSMRAVTQKFGIFVFFKNTAIFYFVVTAFRNHRFSNFGKYILKKWSDCTLIIYLIHYLLLQILYDHNFLYGSFDMSPWLGVWIYAILVYIVGGLLGVVFHMVWDPINKALFHKKK